MNLTIISFAMAIGVFLWAALTSTDNPKTFLDLHGFVIVVGGTIAAGSISFQIDKTIKLVKIFWLRSVMGARHNYVATIKELMKFADAYRNDSPDLKTMVDGSKDHFMKEAMGLLMDEVVDIKQLHRLLKARVDTMFERYTDDAGRFKAMGKYPPAMGLMGAVLGMIALLSGLGKPGAESTIGPAMSIALVATLYGIAIANLVIIPIGDNLAEGAKEQKRKNLVIREGVKLIADRTNPIVLAEELNSYLLPAERIDWKKQK